jgi:hypothetical protein
VQEREPTLFEIWVCADGYWCDHTKNVCPGELDARYDELLEALLAGDEGAGWRFKWEHPSFRGRSLRDVRAASLSLDDARLVIARHHAFAQWSDLAAFVQDLAGDPQVIEFETAVDALVDGDLAALQSMLRRNPRLVRARSTRMHHATLLHYVAANGVESARQRTPANAVAIATAIVEAGAAADALADMYDGRWTTLGLLVSSAPPAEAGVQAELAQVLLDHGEITLGIGGAARAKPMLAEAEAKFAELRAVPWLERAAQARAREAEPAPSATR